ncbi:MAG: HlyC/CorC family transporter [Armatimonadetes bacterium]|nr:HlyC/CorC family transporter [Armatimonadota bacterium]
MDFVILLVLMLVSGLFAMAEISIVSSRKVRLEQMAADGHRGASSALYLASHPMVFLSTIQIGITVIGILAGVFGEKRLAAHVGQWLEPLVEAAPTRELIASALIVVAVTYLTLVLGELAPKRIGLHHAERIAAALAPPMNLLARVASPLVKLLTASTDLVVRAVGIRGGKTEEVTEEEVRILIEQATRAGVFTTAEEELLKSAFRLADRDVQMLMTPRTEVDWIDLESPPEEQLRRVAGSRHSRFPVGRGSLDNIEGVLVAKDILHESIEGQEWDAAALMQKPLLVPEGTSALRFLELLKAERGGLAMVIDEYGGVAGLVSLADVLEALVGELPGIDEPDEGMAVQRADGSWLIDGLMPIDQFKELFDLAALPDEAQYVTAAGFVMHELGRLPRAADRVEFESYEIEVVDMDGKRVDKVLVQPVLEPQGGEPGDSQPT